MLTSTVLASSAFAWQPSIRTLPVSRPRVRPIVAGLPSPLEECVLSVSLDMVPECMRMMNEKEALAQPETQDFGKNMGNSNLATCLEQAHSQTEADECILSSEAGDEPSYG